MPRATQERSRIPMTHAIRERSKSPMPRAALRFSTIALAIAAAGCRPATVGLTDVQRAAITASVNSVVDSLVASGSALDTERYLRHFSAQTVYAENGTVFDDWSTITAAVPEVWGRFVNGTLTVGARQVRVLGPNAAVLTSPFEWQLTDTAGARIGYRGAWTLVFARTDDRWEIVYSHESFSVANGSN